MIRSALLLICTVAGIGRAFAAKEDPNLHAPDHEQRLVEQRARELEKLKLTDPDAYRKTKEVLSRRESVRAVLARWKSGQLSESEAQSQLMPLARQEAQSRIQNLSSDIEELERKLAKLKRFKSDPDALARELVEQMMGKRQPDRPLP